MPDAVTFRVSTYWKLAKGETGLTSMSSLRVPIGTALEWILREIPEEALTVESLNGVATIVIDWKKCPESVRNPKIPVRRR